MWRKAAAAPPAFGAAGAVPQHRHQLTQVQVQKTHLYSYKLLFIDLGHYRNPSVSVDRY